MYDNYCDQIKYLSKIYTVTSFCIVKSSELINFSTISRPEESGILCCFCCVFRDAFYLPQLQVTRFDGNI